MDTHAPQPLDQEIPEVEETVPHVSIPTSHKAATTLIIMAIVLIVGLAAYYFGRVKSIDSIAQPTPSPVEILVTSTPSIAEPSPTPEPTASPSAVMGTVKGKLCYPSQFLPEGTIEAKNTLTKEVATLNYPGSENGGASSYSFDLNPGSYYLRYKTSGDSYGYHSETCPTGMETSCAQENERVLVTVNVEAGQTIDGHDLCDFYYSEDTKPEF